MLYVVIRRRGNECLVDKISRRSFRFYWEFLVYVIFDYFFLSCRGFFRYVFFGVVILVMFKVTCDFRVVGFGMRDFWRRYEMIFFVCFVLVWFLL